MHSRVQVFQVGQHVYVNNLGGLQCGQKAKPDWIYIIPRVRPLDGRVWKQHVDHIRICYLKKSTSSREPEILEGPLLYDSILRAEWVGCDFCDKYPSYLYYCTGVATFTRFRLVKFATPTTIIVVFIQI